MSQPLIYLDSSDVQEGALDELRGAISELVAFIEANEPRILAYNIYLSDDGRRMTVFHMHADAASLDFHMEVGGPAFRRFEPLISLSSIRVFGEPSERARRLLCEKARMLGGGEVLVESLQAGFNRLSGAGSAR